MITIKFLRQIHPELTKTEAKDLKEFAAGKTITHKECYSKGQIIYPMWLKHNRVLKVPQKINTSTIEQRELML